MNSTISPIRRYKGLSLDERKAQRRQQLIEAAVQVYGEHGYRQATVKAVCEAAGLTERYFYESFSNSEQLLLASFHAVTFRVFDLMRKAGHAAPPTRLDRGRAMLHTYFHALRQRPLSARLFLVETRGVSQTVEDTTQALWQTMVEGVFELSAPGTRPEDPLLLAGALGAVLHISLRWIAQAYTPPIEEVVEAALQMMATLWRKPLAE